MEDDVMVLLLPMLLLLLRLHGLCCVLNWSESLARFMAFVLVVGLFGECKHTHMLMCIQKSHALFFCAIASASAVAGLWMAVYYVVVVIAAIAAAATATITTTTIALFGDLYAIYFVTSCQSDHARSIICNGSCLLRLYVCTLLPILLHLFVHSIMH